MWCLQTSHTEIIQFMLELLHLLVPHEGGELVGPHLGGEHGAEVEIGDVDNIGVDYLQEKLSSNALCSEQYVSIRKIKSFLHLRHAQVKLFLLELKLKLGTPSFQLYNNGQLFDLKWEEIFNFIYLLDFNYLKFDLKHIKFRLLKNY